ncbi:MAG: DUF2125 domain-containing protein [Emcibacter sp.]|nr:DUF2125 domain-containing protein [Emcibacter sp.]
MRLKLLISTVLFLILSYSFFWYYMAGELEDTIEIWADEQKSKGLSFQYEESEISGFPYRLEFSFKNLKIIKTNGNRLPILFTSPRITWIAFPWRITHGVIFSEGGGLRIGRRRYPEMLVGFGKSRASVVLDPVMGKFQRASFVLEGVTWATGENAREGKQSRVRQVKLHIMRPAPPAQVHDMELPVQMKLYLEADDFDLMPDVFDNRMAQITIDLQLHGEELPDYSTGGLSLWRDYGGTLAVKNFEITSGKMHMELGGEVTLDQDLKPLGAFSGKLASVPQITAILSANPTFQQEPGRLVLQELNSMGRLAGNEDKEARDFAVSLQNGLLYLGSIATWELAPVVE